MKSTYTVIWAAVARSDLQQIIDYVADDSPDNALRLLGKIRQQASALNRFPGRGRVVPELKAYGMAIYREIIVTPWRIIYRVSDTTLYVLAVIDSRQNVEDILLQRFIR